MRAAGVALPREMTVKSGSEGSGPCGMAPRTPRREIGYRSFSVSGNKSFELACTALKAETIHIDRVPDGLDALERRTQELDALGRQSRKTVGRHGDNPRLGAQNVTGS